jgi:uncharacterized protein YjdB
MKRGIYYAILCLFFGISAMAQVVPVTGVSLSLKDTTLGIGETHRLTATIAPNNATVRYVTWETSNSKVAIVSGAGLITALSTGTANIIVQTQDGGFTDTCKVTVYAIPVTGVSLDKKTLRLYSGTNYQLNTTITPKNATDQSVCFTSEDEHVAEVTSKGLIWAGYTGITRVIVAASDGNLTDTCVVTVVEPNPVSVSGVLLDRKTVALAEGETLYLNQTILPNVASNKQVTWETQDPAIATVSVYGLITANNAGSTNITVKTVDQGKTASCSVTVVPKDFVMLKPETVTNEKTVNFSIHTPEYVSLTGSFSVRFPEGISLNEHTTQLSAEYQAGSSLSITDKGDNSWLFEIKDKTPVLLHAGSLQNIMEIGYATEESVIKGDFEISFNQINFKLNDGSELKKDHLTVKVHVDDTATGLIDSAEGCVYLSNNRLYIESGQSETIYIYSFNGTLLYTDIKEAGKAAFDLNNIQEPVIIVKGSSGWTEKVVK